MMLTNAVAPSTRAGGKVVELLDLGKADVHLRALLLLALAQQLGQPMQGLRAEHHVHIRRPLDDGRALLAGDAAAHADQHAFFLEVLDAPEVAENLFLGLFPHRAGVEQDQVGFLDVLASARSPARHS